jgi:hypothetical protein
MPKTHHAKGSLWHQSGIGIRVASFHLERSDAMAKPILKPMQVRIPDSARNWLKGQAKAQERSMNYVLNRLLEQAQKQGVANDR